MSKATRPRAPEEWIPFASVGRPHGLKGAFFLSTEDRRSELGDYRVLLVKTKDGDKALKVVNTYASGGMLVVQLEGIGTREAAETLYKCPVSVNRREITVVADEYLVGDLRGMQVFAEGKGEIGEVTSVVNFGAQENLEIRLKGGTKTVYFPFMEPFVKTVDADARRIEIEYVGEFLEDDKP